MRKLWAIAATLGLILTTSATSINTPAQAATPTPPTVAVRPVSGATFAVSGTLATRVSRPVELQQKVGSGWKRVALSRTTTKGAYSFKMSTPAALAQLRVVARTTTIKKRTYPLLVSHTSNVRTVSVSPAVPIKRERFVVTDSLHKAGVRRVVLQRKSGSRWVKVTSAKTDRGGRFTMASRVTRATTFRVVAPRAKINGKGRAAVQLKAFRISTATQRASMVQVSPAATGQALVFRARFSPARVGRAVALQKFVAPQWRTVATAVQSSTGTATLATTPDVVGRFSYRAIAVAARGAAAAASLPTTVTVVPGTKALSIEGDTSASAAVDDDFYAALIVAGGRAPYAWEATELPDGIVLTADGKLVGRPTTEGIYRVHVKATDADNRTAEADITITVAPALAISEASLPRAVSGTDYLTSLTATGGTGPYTWSATGLPEGITLDPDGTLSGTTTALGNHHVSLRVTDSESRSVSKTLIFAVVDPLVITPPSLSGARTGAAFSAIFTATGGTAPYTWRVDEAPPGLTMSEAGVLSGTPSDVGTFDKMVVTVTDHSGATTSKTVAMEVSSVTIDSLASGDASTCAVDSTGTVKCWGSNKEGQLGTGDRVTRLTPTAVTGLSSDMKAVGNGVNFGCALSNAGAVSCWGYNVQGQLGNGVNYSSYTPVGVNGLSSGVTSIAVGGSHVCALTSEGAVKCWGDGQRGQLGNGTSNNALAPVGVTGLDSGVVAIAAGKTHSCAVTSTGEVQCWGDNQTLQLGRDAGTFARTPGTATGLPSDIVSIAAGAGHSCALTSTGAAWCWGGNASGQLGNGKTTNSVSAVPVTGLGSAVSAISLGANHSCAVLAQGQTQCWGANAIGQLGDGTTTNRTTPVQVSGLDSGITLISAGKDHTCAVVNSHALTCWGQDSGAQLGDRGGYLQPIAYPVAGLSQASVLVSQYYGACALTSAGGVACWGKNDAGQLGDGTTTDGYGAVSVSGLSSGVTQIAAGDGHACALTSTGAVLCWGQNNRGQIGDGSTTNRLTPVQVSGLTSGVKAISARGQSSCALLDTGELKCWGYNSKGQLGDNTTTNRSTPVTATVVDTDIAEVSAGWDHVCVLNSAGGVRCWGSNNAGQLGDGTTTDSRTPRQVTGLTSDVKSISGGLARTCALTTAGNALCWGSNSNGRLGDGTQTNATTPVSVLSFDRNVASVTPGGAATCATTTAGAAYCWGYNADGELGDGTFTSRDTPGLVTGLDSGIVATAGGNNLSCALHSNGSVSCWGYNDHGQVGRVTNYSLTPVAAIWP